MRRLSILAWIVLVAACDGPPAEQADGGSCDPGALGCECARGDRCGTAGDGEPLVCDEGTCVPARCAPGSAACVCRAGSECDGDDLECRGGVCRPAQCAAGEEGCECLLGSCEPGLHCNDGLGSGTCVDATGWPGGPCPESGLCRQESRCDNDLDVCVPCSPGSQGCVPRDGVLCNEGLALMAGRCVPPPPMPPADPQCHTPCRSGLVAEDGTFRACTAGFLDGCIDDQICDDGTCVAPGEAVPSCAADLDCPSFQTCIADRCYSTCERDSECPMGLRCHDLVCRVPCRFPSTAENACPAGTFCDSENGTGGVCMPLGAPDLDAPAGGPPAVFDLSAATLSLGAGVTALGIELHDAHVPETFTVERLSHRGYDRDGNLVEEVDRADGGSPLDWLTLSFAGTEAPGDLEVVIDPDCEDCPAIQIGAARPPAASGVWRWEGTLAVRHPRLGQRHVTLSWCEGIDGRWSGTMSYFANFDSRGVAEWSAGDRSRAPATLRNALLLRWIAFRNGSLAGGSRELSAMLSSVATGSWSQPATREACRALVPSGAGACYLYDARPEGVEVFTANLDERPIPSGMMELPIALNLRAEPGAPAHFEGRIESRSSLHEAGNPAIDLTFASAPADCRGAGCMAFVDSMSAVIGVGGRFRADDTGCPSDFVRVEQPWLVTGLGGSLTVDELTGRATRAECRERSFPFVGADAAANPSFSAANPIPDGRPLRRTLRALDGALVDGETLIVLFEERFDSFLDPADSQGFSAYGTMVLRRQPTALERADYVANTVPVLTRTPVAVGLSCDPDLVARALERADGSVSAADAEPLSRALIEGVSPTATVSTFDPARVHFYCDDTGLIDGGAGAAGGAISTAVPCPAASNVTYFAFLGPTFPTAAQIAGLACQTPGADGRGTCGSVLANWRVSRSDIQLDPVWSCSDGSLYCDVSRTDLRLGRTFYQESGGRVFTPLAEAIQVAFRYKLRFRSPDGRSVGFAPVVCEGDGGLTPYCYDPEAVDEVRARMDCLVSLYDAYGAVPEGALRPAWLTELQRTLSESLGAVSSGTPLLQDGFERLYAELLIMLGDEALTAAYRSRFDSAAVGGAVFSGSAFEPGGIDLSGVAGFEMSSLHRAAQHYQLALDRLYDLAPTMYVALGRGDVGHDPVDVITPETATWYLDRIIRGAAQKARAWSEIARRYHEMHRPDLARSVLERAYAGSYLESIAITRLMHRIAESAGLASRDELFRAVEDAQRRYRIALTEMREVHEELDDEILFFGYTGEYVPFPVRDSEFRGSNPFEDVLLTTDRFVADARSAEDAAISGSRSFDTDAAQFQAELVRLTRSYEERLGPTCGFFTGRDGRTYPAIATYGHLDDRASLLGDPCGRMGNGEIHQLVGRLRELTGQTEVVRTRRQHVLDAMEGEKRRVEEQCGLILGNADYVYQRGSEVLSMQDTIRNMNLGINAADRANQAAQAAISASLGGGALIGATGASLAASAVSTGVALGLQGAINGLEHDIQQSELDTARWQTERQCDALLIDLDAATAQHVRQAHEVHLEALQVALQLELALAELRRAALSAQRLQQELADAEELAIRVESARNDPNVRLYRNDAILNADASFDLAMRHVYRLTRVYEYYTSQSYPGLDRLFRIRMVSRGDDNLDRYVAELRDSFLTFEEDRRSSASRVTRISLMTDVFGIPRSLPQGERERQFRERLSNPSFLDANGHVIVPFRTDVGQLSPCTRNHKINFIEVAIQGADLGDDEANVMVWQEGTGSIETFEEGTRFYRLPPQLSIVQAYFGRNNTVFDPSVYRRMELRDRPYADTQWRLSLDLRDDPHNTDLVLANITDIYLYVYYTDFTDTRACRR